MIKKIKLSESQLTKVVENVIKEQINFSDDPNSFTTKVDDVDMFGVMLTELNVEELSDENDN